jgi:nicotinamide-nucleotide adenylyltransferase
MNTLFIGRFQPFHNGHLHDIKNALKFSDKIIIAIGSSQEKETKENPFSYEERKEMIEKVSRKENLKGDISIIAVPDINDDDKWVEHVVSIVGKIDIVYTGNGWVKRLFSEEGFKVEDVHMFEDINATEIRKRIDRNENWQDLVPHEVVEYLRKVDGVNRIKEINGVL